ncbi:MAG: phospholipase D-like domain-containing protein [Lysobacterales bacterium]
MWPWFLLAFCHALLAVASIYHVLLYKRDPRAALSWILMSVALPLGGGAYFVFGVNRIRKRALGRGLFSVAFESGGARQLTANVSGRGIDSVGQRVSGQETSAGNSVGAFFTGETAYHAMCQSIHGAKHRVWLSTYIFKVDSVGETFSDALRKARERGVDVKVIIDGVGEKYASPSPVAHLRKLGIAVVSYLPPKLIPPGWWLNLRNHRKLLVIDNHCAYCGGINVSEDHTGSPPFSADVQFSLGGPVVADLAQVFARDWQFAAGQTLLCSMPAAEQSGSERCRVIPDGPDEQLDALALTINAVIGAAQRSVDIMVPYFLPGRALTAALQAATLRGIAVRIVLPERSNLRWVDWAQRNGLADLLRWGICVYFQPSPFCHAKLLKIDDAYLLIGSANLDPRSLRLNFEIGVEVFGQSSATVIANYFDSVLEKSTDVSMQWLQERSVPVRLRDSAAALFSPYL